MTAKTQSNRKPTHAVYHVRGEGDNAYWTKVGAAWLHDDKEGLSVSLDYMPIGEGRLVVRVNKPDATPGESR